MAGFGWWYLNSIQNQIDKVGYEYQQLSDELARASSKMVTKQELDKFSKDLTLDIDKVRKDLNKLGLDLKALGVTVASIEANQDIDTGSDNSTPQDPPDQPDTCELCDIHGYTASVESKDISIAGMPYAEVEFRASEDKPWSVFTDKIDVVVDTAVGEKDKDGRPMAFYHTIYLKNKSRPELVDKKYKLKITSSKFLELEDKPLEIRWWDPHIEIGIFNGMTIDDGVAYLGGAELGLSIMSYGKTSHNNILRFPVLGLGVSTGVAPYLSFTPIQYNLGKQIPLIDDLWIGPSVVYNFKRWSIGISIGTTL
jgi:hypothetical protein